MFLFSRNRGGTKTGWLVEVDSSIMFNVLFFSDVLREKVERSNFKSPNARPGFQGADMSGDFLKFKRVFQS